MVALSCQVHLKTLDKKFFIGANKQMKRIKYQLMKHRMQFKDTEPFDIEEYMKRPVPLIKAEYDKIDDYIDLKSYLSSGTFSKVYLAFEKRLQKIVVVKILIKRGYSKAAEISSYSQDVRNEVAALQKLPNHPNICQFLYFLETEKNYYIVQDFCGSNNLYTISHIKLHEPMPEKRAAKYMRDALRGLESLHNHSIYHRDIRLQNLMLDDEDRVRIIDFGLAAFSNRKTYEQMLTPWEICPEMASGEGFIPEKTDIWELGVRAHELVFNALPIFKTEKDKFGRVNYEWHPRTAKHTPSTELLDFLSAIFVHQSKRPKATELLNHPWITNNQ